MPVECVVPLTVKQATTTTMRRVDDGRKLDHILDDACRIFRLGERASVHRVYGATMRGNWVTRRRLIHRKKTNSRCNGVVSMGCCSFHFSRVTK